MSTQSGVTQPWHSGESAPRLIPYLLIYDLFLLNLTLQLFDGMATYVGIQLGVREANPILVATFQRLGTGPSLLLFKAFACGLLFLLSRRPGHRLVLPTLVLLALTHLSLSLVPWSITFARIWIHLH